MKDNIIVYLTVCEDAGQVTIRDRVYEPGYKGESNIQISFDNDKVAIDLSPFGYRASLGDTDGLEAISVHKCSDNLSVFMIYDNPRKTALAACCNAGGCSCYAPVGCDCGISVEI